MAKIACGAVEVEGTRQANLGTFKQTIYPIVVATEIETSIKVTNSPPTFSLIEISS